MADISLEDSIAVLEQHSKYLTDDQLYRLSLLVKPATEATPFSSGSNVLDGMVSELNTQMNFVIALREKITRGGDATVRDIKDMTQATSSLFKMLTQMHKDITNQDRLRKIEVATIAAIKTLPAAAQTAYFSELERLLTEDDR